VIPTSDKLFPDGLRFFLHFLLNFEVQAYGMHTVVKLLLYTHL
jgi:hypothetical protein